MFGSGGSPRDNISIGRVYAAVRRAAGAREGDEPPRASVAKNVISALTQREIRCTPSHQHNPHPFVNAVVHVESRSARAMMDAVRRLHDLQVLFTDQGAHLFLDVLQWLSMDDSDGRRDAFLLHGGEQVCVKAILRCGNADWCAIAPRVMLECIVELGELCLIKATVARCLSSNSTLLLRLFELMRIPSLFDSAVRLAEELIAIRPEIFDLTDVPNIGELVCSFSAPQLCYFGRILVLTTYFNDDTEHLLDPLHDSPTGNTTDDEDDPSSLSSTSNVILSPLPPSPPRGASKMLRRLIPKTNRDQTLQERRASRHRTISRNKALILGIPSLFDRLVHLMGANRIIRRDESGPHDFGGGPVRVLHLSTADRDAVSLEHATSVLTLNPNRMTTSVMQAHVNGLFMPDTTSAVNCVLSMFQSDVLFVLSTLIASERAQDTLVRFFRLGGASYIERLLHRAFECEPHFSDPHIHVHGEGCECNPESVFRIQLLRLLHHIYDTSATLHTEIPRHLLSQSEIVRLSELHKSHYDALAIHTDLPPYKSISFTPPVVGVSSSGLSTSSGVPVRLCRLLLAHQSDSEHRFWLLSCVESFARSASDEEKALLIEEGILPYLVQLILEVKDSLQGNASLLSNFDLLGEFVKWSAPSLLALNSSLTPQQCSHLLSIAQSRLIDSNVFLRDLLLTVMGHQISPSILLSAHIRQREWRMNFIEGLLTTLESEELCSDNICCLNTSLICLLLFTLRKPNSSSTDSVSNSSAHSESECGDTHSQSDSSPFDLRLLSEYLSPIPIHTLLYFRSLMEFWLLFYTLRGKDTLALQNSSKVPFALWRKLAQFLLSDSECSINGIIKSVSLS